MKTDRSMAAVLGIEDPAKGGAVKVGMPELGGDEYPEWIEPVCPAGVFFHPEVGDTVAVDMPEGEDVTEFSEEVRYLGKLIAETEGYPDNFKTNYPYRRGLQTKGGHALIFDDKSGSEEIKLVEGKTGNYVSITGKGEIKIGNVKAGSEIVMSASGAITITPASPLTLDGIDVRLSKTATDYIVKGTTFNSSLGTYLTACATLASVNYAQFQALETAATGVLAPLATAFGVIKTAWQNYGSAVSALQGAMAAWLSTQVKTG